MQDQQGVELFKIEQEEHEPIAIKTSMLNTQTLDNANSQASVISMLNMNSGQSSRREDVKKQVQLLLAKHGISLESNIMKYKSLLDMELDDKPKVADVLKLLQYLDKLNGVELNEDKQGQQVTNNYLNMVVNKPDNEVIGLLEQTMSKTQEYLKRMKTPTQQDKLKEINDSVNVAE